jgi:DNA-binding transcriptional ArsR family regulator
LRTSSSVGAQPDAVSQHLAKLRLAKIVRARREGNRVFYAAEDDHVRRLAAEALFHVGVTELPAAGHHPHRAVS